MAVHGHIMIDNRVGPTQGFAVVVLKAVDEDGASIGNTEMYFVHNSLTFDGTFDDLAECCSGVAT